MTTSATPHHPIEKPRFRARFNWPLIIGTLLVGLVIYLAIVGPTIAPHDPLQENMILKDARTGEWHIPPFPAFEVTGYPLGSDEFGRDMYSRLLWAIRPTLQMVAIVALVRLVLGTLIGLLAGWSAGRMGAFFDTLISGALALPGLLVALGTIAIVGVELGLIAFVIGLSITGWAETARIVREQTRLIKSQVYIEAANALGASGKQIVFQHVVRQIQAMLLMLLAFEIGSTLMLTAGLGFLGYYIGGDVWVDVSDFVARRTSGAPELGQMLATAWVRLTDPWGLVSVGSVVFMSVLGFNLIGEGLRLRLNQEVAGGMLKWLGERTAGLFLNVEHYITYPIGKFFERPGPFLALRLLLGLIIGATGMWGWEQGWFKLPEADISFLNDTGSLPTARPGQNTVPAATPTPQTQVISTAPEEPPPTPLVPQVMWTLETGSIFTGAPILASDGTIYATTADNLLYALTPDGRVKWQFTLPARGVETPALAPDGTLYVTDREGALNAISPAGEAVWRFVPPEGRAATSGPVVGPEGNIYYASGSQTGIVQAVSPTGEGLWRTKGATFSYHNPPQVSADGRFVFLQSDAFNTADGRLLALEYPSKIDRFLVGRDGSLYFRTGHNVITWQMPNATPEILQSYTWNYPFSEETLPAEAGITQNGVSWELYTTEFGGSTSIFWIEEVDNVGRLLFSGEVPLSQGRLVYLDDVTLFAVICGLGDYSFTGGQSAPKPECHGLHPNPNNPAQAETRWVIQIQNNGVFKGAVYNAATEILYLTTEEGQLYAVDSTPALDPGEIEPTTNNGWTFVAPEPLLSGPILGVDGSIALVSQAQNLYILAPDGSLKASFPLPNPVFMFQGGGFDAGYSPLLPVLMRDGSVLVISEGLAYALNPDGTPRWEFPLEETIFSSPFLDPVSGQWYLIDRLGTLYAFSTEGLVWVHDLEEGLKAAAPFPVFGPNGEIYYTITTGARGKIEALNPDGTQLWRTDLTTFSFYKPMELTLDNQWIMVDDNLLEASTGRLVNTDSLEFDVTTFAVGYNGKNYLLAGSSIMEWEIAGDGIRVLSQVPVALPENFQRAITPGLSISRDGIYWIRIFTSQGHSQTNLWANAQGEIVSNISFSSANEQILKADEENNRLYVCNFNLDASRLECRGYDGKSNEPVWQLNIEGVTAYEEYFYTAGRMYIWAEENTVQVLELVLP
ncbi:MAG: hypothetical protein Fur0022_18880 [Anaerolineales bacterium]